MSNYVKDTIKQTCGGLGDTDINKCLNDTKKMEILNRALGMTVQNIYGFSKKRALCNKYMVLTEGVPNLCGAFGKKRRSKKRRSRKYRSSMKNKKTRRHSRKKSHK